MRASRFGIMFFDEPSAAFANLVCWLAPGGQFAFAVWGRPIENPWMTCVREVVAEIIDLPLPDSEAPGPFRYAEAETLLPPLGRAGFGEIEAGDWRGALPIGGGLRAAEAADFALASFSSFGELLAEAGGEALNDARRSLTERLSRNQHGAVARMDASVRIFTGARPG